MAQCSATGVSVAATPVCSAIRFQKEIFPGTPHLSSLQNTPNTVATGGGKTGATPRKLLGDRALNPVS